MGNDLFTEAKNWLDSCTFPDSLNDTLIVLIPKKQNSVSMKDLRPISLCNVTYKVVVKVLANRLCLVLLHLISEEQYAFISGRSILDNVMVAFEVIHGMRCKSTGKNGYVAFKIDISKAYDRILWTYLHDILSHVGFDDKWI